MTVKKEKKELNLSLSQKIEEIIENITKEYGEGTITTLGKSRLKEQKVLSTGSLLLNQAIGTGGYVCGKIVEIYGLESSGKSTLALHAVSECQKLGKKAVYIDLENGLNIKYAQNIGVDKENLMIAYPGSAMKAFLVIRDLIRVNTDLIVIDSVSNLSPQVEDLEKYKIGSHALLMSQGLKILKSELTNKETIIIFINQVRNKISTGYYGGNPETTTGGMALRFDADLRIKLKRTGKIEKNDKLIGIEIEAFIKKSKIGEPEKTAKLEIIFGRGIQKEREIIDLATELDILQKSGNWYSYGEKKLGNGKDNVADYLAENSEIYQEIEKNIMEKINSEEKN
ncbi:MAG: DNA recombination/repair protein RecA [Candidatus Moeniiplasma glomeromycotorum]|nr:DNA recombination/repair protein RecA [Candidatus Moeniiplasma glomeromycotorum]MCE8168241.1 DNA recombination/repair protein RecA [Candidatus Moeniiplasma glomeromycotorum]